MKQYDATKINGISAKWREFEPCALPIAITVK